MMWRNCGFLWFYCHWYFNENTVSLGKVGFVG